MPLSMTGFGAARYQTASGGSVTIEIKTVNHRHLDVRWHGFTDFSAFIIEAEKELRKRLNRGRVDVRLQAETEPNHRIGALDEVAVRKRVEQVRRLAGELELPDDLTACSLLALGPSFVLGSESGPERIEPTELSRALGEALGQVLRMRGTEGAQTTQDLSQRLEGLKRLFDQVEAARKGIVPQRQQRIRKRLDELLQGQPLDEDRTAQEVALLADRSDVSEELERARGHVLHFEEQLEVDGPVGRRLDFLLQELSREVNTMGAKAHELSDIVVELKSELEKLREQVQNLE